MPLGINATTVVMDGPSTSSALGSTATRRQLGQAQRQQLSVLPQTLTLCVPPASSAQPPPSRQAAASAAAAAVGAAAVASGGGLQAGQAQRQLPQRRGGWRGKNLVVQTNGLSECAALEEGLTGTAMTAGGDGSPDAISGPEAAATGQYNPGLGQPGGGTALTSAGQVPEPLSPWAVPVLVPMRPAGGVGGVNVGAAPDLPHSFGQAGALDGSPCMRPQGLTLGSVPGATGGGKRCHPGFSGTSGLTLGSQQARAAHGAFSPTTQPGNESTAGAGVATAAASMHGQGQWQGMEAGVGRTEQGQGQAAAGSGFAAAMASAGSCSAAAATARRAASAQGPHVNGRLSDALAAAAAAAAAARAAGTGAGGAGSTAAAAPATYPLGGCSTAATAVATAAAASVAAAAAASVATAAAASVATAAAALVATAAAAATGAPMNCAPLAPATPGVHLSVAPLSLSRPGAAQAAGPSLLQRLPLAPTPTAAAAAGSTDTPPSSATAAAAAQRSKSSSSGNGAEPPPPPQASGTPASGSPPTPGQGSALRSSPFSRDLPALSLYPTAPVVIPGASGPPAAAAAAAAASGDAAGSVDRLQQQQQQGQSASRCTSMQARHAKPRRRSTVTAVPAADAPLAPSGAPARPRANVSSSGSATKGERLEVLSEHDDRVRAAEVRAPSAVDCGKGGARGSGCISGCRGREGQEGAGAGGAGVGVGKRVRALMAASARLKWPVFLTA